MSEYVIDPNFNVRFRNQLNEIVLGSSVNASGNQVSTLVFNAPPNRPAPRMYNGAGAISMDEVQRYASNAGKSNSLFEQDAMSGMDSTMKFMDATPSQTARNIFGDASKAGDVYNTAIKSYTQETMFGNTSKSINELLNETAGEIMNMKGFESLNPHRKRELLLQGIKDTANLYKNLDLNKDGNVDVNEKAAMYNYADMLNKNGKHAQGAADGEFSANELSDVQRWIASGDKGAIEQMRKNYQGITGQCSESAPATQASAKPVPPVAKKADVDFSAVRYKEQEAPANVTGNGGVHLFKDTGGKTDNKISGNDNRVEIIGDSGENTYDIGGRNNTVSVFSVGGDDTIKLQGRAKDWEVVEKGQGSTNGSRIGDGFVIMHNKVTGNTVRIATDDGRDANFVLSRIMFT